jgi:hypothetical protein
MSDPHLRGVLDMLHARALELHMHAMVDHFIEVLRARGSIDGEVLAHQVGASLVDVRPEDYLETTELVRAIRQELARR